MNKQILAENIKKKSKMKFRLKNIEEKIKEKDGETDIN
jgi:hypothetical protein